MRNYQRKERGSYYTPAGIASYLSKHALGRLISARLREYEPALPYERLDDLLANLNTERSKRLVTQILPHLRILDPCCGDGAFLIAALDTLLQVYDAAIGQLDRLADPELQPWWAAAGDSTAAGIGALKRRIVCENLYGVDISAAAVALARARLRAEAQLAANSDVGNIRVGNALVGLLKLPIEGGADAAPDLMLLAEFERLGVKGGSDKDKTGPLAQADIAALQPFHWAAEFPAIVGGGGFDVVLTNPPWEIFKPQAKEFFAQHSDLVSKKRMDIHAFLIEQRRLLRDPEVAAAWRAYLARFPLLSAYYRRAPQYAHQSAMIGKRRTSSDANLYKLFVEQCYNLLGAGGECGMVIPSGIYTDLGATALRQMLFEKTEISGLFCFENRRAIFNAVDNRFKFVALNFGKGRQTVTFPAAFMCHDVSELADFPNPASVRLAVGLMQRLAPSSWSVMELKSQQDVGIVEKMLCFPLPGAGEGVRLRLSSELHMTSDSHLFQTQATPTSLPLYEGKMIWQFDSSYAPPRYWVDEQAGRKALLGKRQDEGQALGYQCDRLAIRAIASSTNQRSLIASIIPAGVFCGNSLLVSATTLPHAEMLFYAALLNSYVLDWFIRMKVTTNINMFYIYQLPLPCYRAHEPYFDQIVQRAQQLNCPPAAGGAGAKKQRTQLRAALDASVAHLYGLSGEEFAHILSTFKMTKEISDFILAEYARLKVAAL
jgi:hypothetical protein